MLYDQRARLPKLVYQLVDIPEQEYRRIRERLVTFFRLNGTQDPEGYADEVICRTVRRVTEGAEIDPNLTAFCIGIARNVLLESRKGKKFQELPADLPGKPDWSFGHLSHVEQVIFLHDCLRVLSPEHRTLFLEYHLGDRLKLAERRNLSKNALRIQVHRIAKSILDRIRASKEEDSNP
jgi:DNA-directed RNA polymerase specialized sigma24 family protein